MESARPQREIIPALDGVRGLAIALVLLSHFLVSPQWAGQPAWNLLQFGWLGVDLFFVLSGFLITGILLDTRRQPGYWKGFYRRRLLRIFPLYYASVLFVWMVVLTLERNPNRLQGYDGIGWFFGFVPNIAMALKGDWLSHSNLFDLNHLWSVAVEEQFYIVWPLLVWLFPPRWLAFLCLLVLTFSTDLRLWTDVQFGKDWSMASYVLPHCRLDGLLTGAFIAIALKRGWDKYTPWMAWPTLGLFAWSAWKLAHFLLYGGTHAQGTLAAWMFGSLLFLSLRPGPFVWWKRFFEMGWLRHLGRYSYGLYVIHHLLRFQWMNFFGNALFDSALPPWLAQTLFIALAFAGTYALARFTWVAIEKPFLRLK